MVAPLSLKEDDELVLRRKSCWQLNYSLGLHRDGMGLRSDHLNATFFIQPFRALNDEFAYCISSEITGGLH